MCHCYRLGEQRRRGRSHKSLILNDYFRFAFVPDIGYNGLINRERGE